MSVSLNFALNFRKVIYYEWVGRTFLIIGHNPYPAMLGNFREVMTGHLPKM